ncbi:uncharacterized protein LOC116265889 isoform X1 [Nymphaea colorata]|nr:uncharacterized protein LOC116265889 isoform X1 [Nymphaea colorata]XP_031502727.1 uncharacterized protein LOC116265889 isoform X1 [Nymphaea colorata]XP_031502728.1 uncharacterized protein LOC116265889 isoform X1 [Nymphaea colorata]XP_031502729.1 uncharacterized protein LOC116265889 isoform X1 [Nymphaea colorata]
MQALKVGWTWKTFALASSHESDKKKPRSRKTREERKALVESFITTYRSSNNGNFPSLSLTQKEVGGSFYTVREIMKEIMQGHETSSASVLALEDEALNRSLPQKEELNLATLSSADIYGIGNEQGSFIPNNDYQKIQNYAGSSELSAGCKSQEEGSEIEKSFSLNASLSNLESYTLIKPVPASDQQEQLQSCVGEFNENSDEADKSVVNVEPSDPEEVKLENIESFSPTVDDPGDKCINLPSSIENADPLLSSHDNKWSLEAYDGPKEGRTLQDGEIPKGAHVSVGSNSILEQFEESCLGELMASDTITQVEGRAENFDDNKNPNLEYDSSSNSGVGDSQSEDGTLDDVLAVNGAIRTSDPMVPMQASAASAARLDGFSDGASVGAKELISQSVASVPVDISTNDETHSSKTISLSSNCKQENTSLESLICENSDSTLSRTSENDSLDSQLNSLQEDEDLQVVTCRNDGSSSQNVDDPLLVPALKSEVGASNSVKVADAISDRDASNKKVLEDALRGSAEGFGAEAGVMSGSSSSNTESSKRSSSERKLVVRRKGKEVTNPLWAVMKAFLSAFIKFWTE